MQRRRPSVLLLLPLSPLLALLLGSGECQKPGRGHFGGQWGEQKLG